MTTLLAVERKGLTDLMRSAKTGKLTRQVRKLARLRYPLVVVEGSIRDMQAAYYRRLGNPAAIASLVAKLMAVFRVPIVFSSNRQMAEYVAYSFMKESVDHHRRKQ